MKEESWSRGGRREVLWESTADGANLQHVHDRPDHINPLTWFFSRQEFRPTHMLLTHCTVMCFLLGVWIPDSKAYNNIFYGYVLWLLIWLLLHWSQAERLKWSGEQASPEACCYKLNLASCCKQETLLISWLVGLINSILWPELVQKTSSKVKVSLDIRVFKEKITQLQNQLHPCTYSLFEKLYILHWNINQALFFLEKVGVIYSSDAPRFTLSYVGAGMEECMQHPWFRGFCIQCGIDLAHILRPFFFLPKFIIFSSST